MKAIPKLKVLNKSNKSSIVCKNCTHFRDSSPESGVCLICGFVKNSWDACGSFEQSFKNEDGLPFSDLEE